MDRQRGKPVAPILRLLGMPLLRASPTTGLARLDERVPGRAAFGFEGGARGIYARLIAPAQQGTAPHAMTTAKPPTVGLLADRTSITGLSHQTRAPVRAQEAHNSLPMDVTPPPHSRSLM